MSSASFDSVNLNLLTNLRCMNLFLLHPLRRPPSSSLRRKRWLSHPKSLTFLPLEFSTKKTKDLFLILPFTNWTMVWPMLTLSSQLPLFALWFHIHRCPSKLTARPSPSDSYIQWLDKVANEKGKEWKNIGIYDMILLSKKEIPPNFELLYSFLNFWNTLTNDFCLLSGMISQTLLDVAAIVDLPVDKSEVC